MAKVRDDFCAALGLNPEHFIALGLHGDGVPHQKGKSMEVLSWNFISDPAGERLLKIFVWSFSFDI